MAFREKSAWIMASALLLGGVLYFGLVAWLSAQAEGLVPPFGPLLAVFTAILVLLAIVGHAVVAAVSPKEANAPLDERDQAIALRAKQPADILLGGGILLSLGAYLVFHYGDLLFYMVFSSLLLSQLAEYVAQIVLYRVALD